MPSASKEKTEPQPEEAIDDKTPQQQDTSTDIAGIEKPRQWLIDRCDGESKIEKDTLGRPFCPMCWPPPCVKYAPDFFEQNCCCETYGAMGAFPEEHRKSRNWLMHLSMATHLVGGVFSILACFALSTNAGLLKAFAFSSGTVTGTVGDVDIQDVTFRVGLKSAYVDDFFLGERVYDDLEDLCTGQDIGIPLTSLENCSECKDVSSELTATMIMGVVTYIPTIASNINRMYYNYDVNCQKVFGTLIALFNLCLSLITWKGYVEACTESFFEGDVKIPVLVPKGMNISTIVSSENLAAQRGVASLIQVNRTYLEQFLGENALEDGLTTTAIDLTALIPRAAGAFNDDETEVRIARVNYDWKPGVGLVLIVIATFIKLIDIINHFLLKTPNITRDLNEQQEYERLYGKGSGDGDEEAEEEEQAQAERKDWKESSHMN